MQNPTLFSAYFGVPPQALSVAGLIDPFLDVDVPLFIDPVLLENSSNAIIRTAALRRFRKHFEILVRMLAISKTRTMPLGRVRAGSSTCANHQRTAWVTAAVGVPAVRGRRTFAKKSSHQQGDYYFGCERSGNDLADGVL